MEEDITMVVMNQRDCSSRRIRRISRISFRMEDPKL